MSGEKTLYEALYDHHVRTRASLRAFLIAALAAIPDHPASPKQDGMRFALDWVLGTLDEEDAMLRNVEAVMRTVASGDVASATAMLDEMRKVVGESGG